MRRRLIAYRGAIRAGLYTDWPIMAQLWRQPEAACGINRTF